MELVFYALQQLLDVVDVVPKEKLEKVIRDKAVFTWKKARETKIREKDAKDKREGSQTSGIIHYPGGGE